MFTVKATYGTETRKLTFGDCDAFPTYDQLYQQLYRVFSGHSFWLSRMIFIPKQDQQFLIGTEVHSRAEYEERVTPYRGKDWPGAVLKLTVNEDTPHKLPFRGLLSPSSSSLGAVVRRDSRRRRDPDEFLRRSTRPTDVRRPDRSVSLFDSLNSRPGVATPPTSFPLSGHLPYIRTWPTPPMAPVPPPPIIYSSPFDPFPARGPDSMLVDSPAPANSTSSATVPASSQQSCCSVEEGRTQIQTMLNSFLRDFERISSNTFGVTVTPPDVEATPLVAPQLNNAAPSDETMHIPGSFNPSSFAPATTAPASGDATTPTVIHRGVMCDVCREVVVGVRHKCMQCPDYDMCTPCYEAPSAVERHHAGHRFFDIATPNSAVHKSIICDHCDLTVVGIRHKCLDCPDYDLCTSCVKDVAQMHNPFHEFYQIHEPGRVVVHTVYSGAGERDARGSPSPRGPRARPASTSTPQASSPSTPVVHNATCDLCDSHIEGDRYKCLNCPDFDTCESCFGITKEQHPRHGFVRIANKKDITMRGSLIKEQANRHHAQCDGCSKAIYGVRFKCLHPSCPDYDLCAKCEAHPIPVHPAAHPMLKMKTPDTVIPTVYRVGGTSMIRGNEDESCASAPEPDVTMPVPTCSPIPSLFGQGNASDQADALSTTSMLSPSPSPIPQLPVQINLSGDLYRELWPAVASEMSEMLEPTSAPTIESQASQINLGHELTCQLWPAVGMDATKLPEGTPVFTSNSQASFSGDLTRQLWPAVMSEPTVVPAPQASEPAELINLDVEDALVTAFPPILAEIAHSSPLSGEALLATPAMIPEPAPAVETNSVGSDYMDVLRRLQQDLLKNALAPEPVEATVVPMDEEPTPDPAPIQLTAGFCKDVSSPFCDDTIRDSRPTVQVVNIQKMEISGLNERYRVILSDGIHLVQGMLHTDLNQLVFDGVLQKNAVISMDRFTDNHIQGKCILVIVKMTVLASQAERIGNPTVIEQRGVQPAARLPPLIVRPRSLPISDIRLSAGFVAEALEPSSPMDSVCKIQPTVQVLSIKAVNPDANPRRYRLIISDGIHFMQGLLATHLNPLIANGSLQKNDVVILTRFSLNEVQQRRLIIFLELDTLSHAGYKLGDPVAPPAYNTAPAPPAQPYISSPAPEVPEQPPVPAGDATLRATFVSDNNIVDGQVFPPGAEFVKSWRIRNDGEVAWPETTDLVWVAGDRVLPGIDERIHVGSVKAGDEVDVSAPEMKAPDAPGKYVNYWRLSNGQDGGQLFGNSIWVDITVAEPSSVSDHSSEGSLASSTLTMPQAAVEAAPATTATSATALSDAGSDISLIDASDVHSLSSDDDWQDSRSHVAPSTQHPGEVEYVVLYEEDSASEAD